MTGRFIVLEGIDGSGTTSQARLLADRLEQGGRSVLRTAEPSKGPIGRMVRERLVADGPKLDPRALALLFAADRIDHFRTEIQPALESGADVICDRYVLSSLAYQSLDCDPAWVAAINSRAEWPDLTIFLAVSVDVAQRRVTERSKKAGTPAEIFDARQLQVRVAERYEELIRTSYSSATFSRVNGEGAPADVASVIVELVDRYAPKR